MTYSRAPLRPCQITQINDYKADHKASCLFFDKRLAFYKSDWVFCSILICLFILSRFEASNIILVIFHEKLKILVNWNCVEHTCNMHDSNSRYRLSQAKDTEDGLLKPLGFWFKYVAILPPCIQSHVLIFIYHEGFWGYRQTIKMREFIFKIYFR